jgi:hypothetical protein
MAGEASKYSFDHVIILLDTETFENPPDWLAGSFDIIEGGVHAGTLLPQFPCLCRSSGRARGQKKVPAASRES